jgi:prolyl oligopeptidase
VVRACVPCGDLSRAACTDARVCRTAAPLAWVKVVDNFDALYDYITNDGEQFYLRTNLRAPKYRIVRLDVAAAAGTAVPAEVVAESEHPLQGGACVHGDRLVLSYLQDCKDVLQIHSLTTGTYVATVPLPIGTVNGPTGRRKDAAMFLQHVSFLSPGVIYRYDFAAPDPLRVFRTTELAGFDPSIFETEQVFYPSKDGTKIPMFLVHKKARQHPPTHPARPRKLTGGGVGVGPHLRACVAMAIGQCTCTAMAASPSRSRLHSPYRASSLSTAWTASLRSPICAAAGASSSRPLPC